MHCRQELHQVLGLPANRPLLKLANAVDPRQPHLGSQQTPAGKAVRLQNVHEGFAAPAGEGGVIHMIDGTYDYHHYMQVIMLRRSVIPEQATMLRELQCCSKNSGQSASSFRSSHRVAGPKSGGVFSACRTNPEPETSAERYGMAVWCSTTRYRFHNQKQ